MLSWSILQYFRPSLSYHLSLRPLFRQFLSGRLRQVLLEYIKRYHFLFQLLDFVSMKRTAQNDDHETGWHRIAWAFLKVI